MTKKEINENYSYLFCLLTWIASEVFTICSTSEAKNATLLGMFSAARLALIFAEIFLFAIVTFLLWQMNEHKKLTFPSQLLGGIFISAAAGIMIPGMMDKENTIFRILYTRSWPFFIMCLVYGIILLHDAKNIVSEMTYGSNLRNEIICLLITVIVLFFWNNYDKLSIEFNLSGLSESWVPFLFVLFSCFLIKLFVSTKNRKKIKSQKIIFLLLLFTFSFTVIRSTQIWMRRINTPSCAYWGELAESFIHGHLYLENPGGFHDLTLYNGRWYVPNPPLPAILLIPFVLAGIQVNTTIYSAVIGSVNTVLIYLLCKKTEQEKIISISHKNILWITAAFVIGSDHLWLATTGQMWFISQLLTVSFTVLAVYLAINHSSPWWSGFCLGCALLCRPNVFPIALCLLGIFLYQEEINKSNIKDNLHKILIWGFKCGTPVILSVGFLLLYNILRFDNPFDFGYTTINGAAEIVASANKYGMFNLHFLPDNFRVMFLQLPRIDETGTRFWFYPYIAGYSIFAMSPWLIYLFRSIKKETIPMFSWFSAASIILMLLLYHNTGAEQFGYRYILDAFAPLIILLSYSIEKRESITFKILFVLSVIEQYIGIYWWYIGRA